MNLRKEILLISILTIVIFVFFSCNLKKDSRKINRNSSGNIISIGDSLNGKRVGEWILLSGGDTTEIRNYRKGKLNGLCIKINNLDDTWFYENWKNDLQNGPSYQICSNGDSLYNGFWQSGKRVGKHTTYFQRSNEIVQVREERKEKLIDLGTHTMVELDNRIATQENFDKNGELHGISISFGSDGILSSYGKYLHGKKEGVWMEEDQDYPKSNIMNIGKYKAGLKDGYWLSYSKKFYNSVSFYEANELFFLNLRERIKKEDYQSQITYWKGQIVRARYYYKGKVFNSEKEKTDYFIKKTFGNVKNSPPKENEFSF